MKYEDLKCEFCDGQGEREINIDGADCMCVCTFCNETGVDLDQLEKFKVSIHKPIQQSANSGQLQQHNVVRAEASESAVGATVTLSACECYKPEHYSTCGVKCDEQWKQKR